MPSIGALAAKITLDTTEFTEGLVLSKREMAQARKIQDELSGSVGKYRQALAGLQKLRTGGALNDREHAHAVSKLRQEYVSTLPIVGRFSGLMNPMAAGMAAASAGVAALSGAVATAGAIVANRIDAIDSMADSAERLGISASSLSRLRGAAFLGDVDPQTIDAALQKMLVNLGKGDDAFAKLNLNVAQLRQMDAAQVFAAIAGEINKLPSKAERLAMISEIFGKANVDLIGMIERFQDLDAAALASGAVVSDSLAESVGRADEAMKQMKLAGEGLANVLTEKIAPAVVVVANALTELARNTDMAKEAAAFVATMWLPPGASDLAKKGLVALGDGPGKIGRNPVDAGGAAGMLGAMLDDKEMKQKADKLGSALAQLREQAAMLGMTKGDQAAFRIAELGGTQAQQQEAAWLASQIEGHGKLLDLEKQRNEERRRRFAENEREAQGVLRELESPQAKAEREFREKVGALDAVGMLTPERFAMLARAGANNFVRGMGEAPFGAPTAVKGSAAARTAIEQAKHANKQTELMIKMERHLMHIARDGGLKVEVIGE